MADAPTDENRPYHRGGVREDAAEAALRLVEAEGAAALSVRAIAAEIGVAHRALYRHFADRDAILDAVAARGFRALAARMAKARAPKALIRAYLEFGLDRAHLYDVAMSRRNADVSSDGELRAAADAVIAASTSVFQASGPLTQQTINRVLALWMLLHGGLTLRRAAALEPRSRAKFLSDMETLAASPILPPDAV